MVCPPATSEAGARRPAIKYSSNNNNNNKVKSKPLELFELAGKNAVSTQLTAGSALAAKVAVI
jgi:hypothetical protein